MKIVRPYARMLGSDNFSGNVKLHGFTKESGIWLMQHIEWCARISHRSEDKVTEDSWRRMLEEVVVKHGDWSVVEHAMVSVDMVVDRGITHEWVRHRLNAFTQESTRFVNYEKKIPPSFIYPQPGKECQMCLDGVPFSARGRDDWYHVNGNSAKKCLHEWLWMDAIDEAERHYIAMVTNGWRPQEARSVLPNALASRIITTSNLRNWRHMLLMRTTLEAHPQMRQVMIPLLAEFKEKIPLLFDDIEPEQKQSEGMKRAR